jgi:ubiquinone/menaquinone biosynthesis C-methylase UbiE
VIAFAGSVPENYERYLRPILFEPYAVDLAQRIGAGRILEIACGTGVLTNALLANPRRTVVATDLNQGMIDVANAKTQSDRVSWRQADAMHLPFADREFDAVACQFGFMFVPDKLAAFREARRVLRPGGALLFSVWDSLAENDASQFVYEVTGAAFMKMPVSMHDRGEIERLVRAAGFQNVALHDVRKTMDASATRDFATGMVRGTPLFDELTRRGDDLDRAIDAIVARTERHRGPLRMNAITVEAS